MTAISEFVPPAAGGGIDTSVGQVVALSLSLGSGSGKVVAYNPQNQIALQGEYDIQGRKGTWSWGVTLAGDSQCAVHFIFTGGLYINVNDPSATYTVKQGTPRTLEIAAAVTDGHATVSIFAYGPTPSGIRVDAGQAFQGQVLSFQYSTTLASPVQRML